MENPKKKILFMIPNLRHGGAEKVLVNLVNNLDKNKYNITLYSIFDDGINKEFLNADIDYQYKFKRVFRGNSHLLKMFTPKFLYNWFIKKEYDIAISFLEGPAARIIAGCVNSKTRKVAWIHTEIQNKKSTAVGFRSYTEAKLLYESFDNIIGVSENIIDSIMKNITEKVPLKVLYNVNETALIKELSEDNVNIDFPIDIPKIISVGKIVKIKGFERLLEVHIRLLKENIKHHIYILGIGKEMAVLQKIIIQEGVQKTFHLLGFYKNPYKYIKKCDLYVCSSYREGFSTAVTEALVLGKPVVSTRVSGADELLGFNNEYGIITENSNEGIYKGLKEMLTKPEKLNYYKKKSEERGSYFSKEKTVKAVEYLFDSL